MKHVNESKELNAAFFERRAVLADMTRAHFPTLHIVTAVLGEDFVKNTSMADIVAAREQLIGESIEAGNYDAEDAAPAAAAPSADNTVVKWGIKDGATAPGDWARIDRRTFSTIGDALKAARAAASVMGPNPDRFITAVGSNEEGKNLETERKGFTIDPTGGLRLEFMVEEAAASENDNGTTCECCGRAIRNDDTAHEIIQGDYSADVDSVTQDGNARTLICDDCAERVYRGIGAGVFGEVKTGAVAALPALVDACEYYLAQLDKQYADLRGAREKIASALAAAKGN